MGRGDWLAEKYRDWRVYLKKTHYLSCRDRAGAGDSGGGLFSFSWLSNWPCLVAMSGLCYARKKRSPVYLQRSLELSNKYNSGGVTTAARIE